MKRFNGNACFPIVLLLVFLTACAGFWALCRYDNKYTWPGPDGKDGILRLDANMEEQYPLIFLDKGWAFYQGKLLTPEDFHDNPPPPDCYLYLGQYGGYELGDPARETRGIGTYRLVIRTNGPPRDRTLELPEIFSAYCLWVNGELKMTMGNPAPGVYNAVTGTSQVTFHAAGDIELIFAVANETNYYSGMVYPPAFGAPEAVGKMLAWRLVIHTFVCSIALLTGLFCLMFGFRHGKRSDSFIFFLLCVCISVYAGYPVIHLAQFYSNTIYTFEKLCQYAALMMLCLLAGRFCKGSVWLRAAAFALSTGACALVLLFPALPCAWDGTAMRYYSGILRFCKWGIALYLICVSLYAAWSRKKYAQTLSSGFVIYGLSLAADEFTPLFEPVYTGWPTEAAGLCLVFLIAAILIMENLRGYREGLLARTQALAAKNELQIQKEHAGVLASYVRRNSIQNHEAKKTLALLRFYFHQGETEKLGTLLDRLYEARADAALPAYCPHLLVNSILASKLSSAREQGIRTETAVDIPARMPVDDVDLCSLLGNLLDNAIEACCRMTSGADKWIGLEMRLTGEYLIIIVRNSIAPNMDCENSNAKKEDYAHGYGNQIIAEIVEKYDGIWKPRVQKEFYEAHAALCFHGNNAEEFPAAQERRPSE